MPRTDKEGILAGKYWRPTLGALGSSERRRWSIVCFFQNEYIEGEIAIMVLTKTVFPVVTQNNRIWWCNSQKRVM